MWPWIEANGAALQAAGSLIGALVGLVIIPVLIAAWRAAHQAARAAADQAEAAGELTGVSKALQYAVERAAAAAEAQVASAEASTALTKQQLVAAKDAAAAERAHGELIRQQTLASLRPVLAFTLRISSAPVSWTVLENQSHALALEVAAFNGTPSEPGKPITLSHTTLAPGVGATVDGIDWGPQKQEPFGQVTYLNPVPIFARYRSQDGRWFRTVIADYRNGLRGQVVEEELKI